MVCGSYCMLLWLSFVQCITLGVNADSMAHGQCYDGSGAAVCGLQPYCVGGACLSCPPVMGEGGLFHASSIAVLWV